MLTKFKDQTKLVGLLNENCLGQLIASFFFLFYLIHDQCASLFYVIYLFA